MIDIKLLSFETPDALTDYLSGVDRSIRLESNVDDRYRSYFYGFEIENQNGTLRLGLSSHFNPSFVEACLIEKSNRVIIGYDQDLAVIDPERAEMLMHHKLFFYFYTFLNDPAHQQLLAIDELGVAALSPSGDLNWEFSTPDIVSGWTIEDEVLALQLFEGMRVAVDLVTGESV